MTDFEWKGIKGTEYLSGVIEALTRDEAIFKLKEDGVIITLLRSTSHTEEKKQRKPFKINFEPSVKLVHVMLITKKLATMLRSGLAILPSLKMVRDQIEDKRLKKTLATISQDVESGSNLSKAFSQHPAVFDSIYINMVRAGESSGRLDTFLDKLVGSIRKTIKMRKTIKSALTYPVILLIVAAIVLAIMMIFVVPVFAQMFGNIGSQLPGPTLMILSVSNFVREPMGGGLTFFLVIVGFISFKSALHRSLVFRRKWHRVVLAMPVVGDMVLNSNLAQIAMVYGNLTSAGVPVIEALDITANSTRNEVIKDAVLSAKRGVFSGQPLSVLLSEIKIIPDAFAQLISVGEQTGNMSEMLETISSYYEEEFDSAVDRLSQMMEPIMICFLGGVIGFILVAMYLPIFKMGQVVTG